MNNNTSSKLYGWTLHENKVLTRIPHTQTLDRMIYVQFGLDIKYLGIPEEFNNYEEAQYLVQYPKLKVFVLKKQLKDIPYPDFWLKQSISGNQCEVNLDLWSEEDFDKKKFPELYSDWLRLRPTSCKNNNIQLKLF